MKKTVVVRYFLTFILILVNVLISHPGIAQNPEVVSVTWFPEVPLPNATIKFTAICFNITSIQIQFCLNGICGLQKNMVATDNHIFEYTFRPGNGDQYTSNGDNLSYELLHEGNIIYSGYLYIVENSKPEINSVEWTPATPVLGNNLTFTVNATDDLGITEVVCNISFGNEYWLFEMEKKGDFYQKEFLPLYSGQYLLNLSAFDNSGQFSTKILAFFVFQQNRTDNTPPILVEAIGIKKPDGKLHLKIYLYDFSGITSAYVLANGTLYALNLTGEGYYTAEIPWCENVQILAKDTYNNTLNQSHKLNIYYEEIPNKSGTGVEADPLFGAIAFLIGIIAGIIIMLFFKNHRIVQSIIIIVLISSLLLSGFAGMAGKSREAGGNIYNGNTCWSCLGLQPKNTNVFWLENYPNGTPVLHPQWVLDYLMLGKPLLVYVHQIPCTGCEIQWASMVKHGIVTEDGKLGEKYAGKISFEILDVTINSPTREKGMEVLQKYSMGPLGTPTTLCFTKKGDKVLWWVKSGVVYSGELIGVMDEAIHMMHG